MKKISEDKEGLISTAYHDDHANKSIVIERKVNHQSILDNNKRLYNLNDGYNKNEVQLVSKGKENKGFFEKFFQLFS
jgi:predicted DNA-binding protein YlxM (UPF0122 family)